MLNVVTEKKNFPAAVLIRRGIVENEKETINLSGPGMLTKFLHVDKGFDGINPITGKKLWIEAGHIGRKKYRIIKSLRIGVNYDEHCKKWNWNFSLKKEAD